MVGAMLRKTNAEWEARFRTAHYRKCTCTALHRKAKGTTQVVPFE